MTDEQVNMLRDKFYEGNFYVQLDSAGVPLSRAEWDELNFQLNPNDVIQPFGRIGNAYTRGTASFVAESESNGPITVIANGKILGDITSASEGDAPVCGESPAGTSVSAKYIPQEYYYRAFAEDGTEWEGFFTVEDAGCTTVVLEAPEGTD